MHQQWRKGALMAGSRKVVKVFLASPGDLVDERQTAKVVVDEFNALWADELGHQVELVGWEETVTQYGRPQELINKDLDQCELFVGMLWQRWGTPPSVGGEYSSGFEEEFERASMSRRKDGRPEISLLLKSIDEERLRDPGQELQKVIDFKKRIIAEKELLFEQFSDLSDFGRRLRRCVTHYVQRLVARERANTEIIEQPAPASPHTKNKTEKTSLTTLSEGAQFVERFISQSEISDGEVSAFEVARFRLIGSLLGKPGNDERALGVHDANLIFANRKQLELGNRETIELADCGLWNLQHEVVPLWYWLASGNLLDATWLPLSSLAGTRDAKVGAMIAMTLIGEQISTDVAPYRTDYLRMWLDVSGPERITLEALRYLTQWGEKEDIPCLRELLSRSNTQIASAAADAIINILAREDLRSAVEELFLIDPEVVSTGWLRTAAGKLDSLPSDLLKRGLKLRNNMIRRIVAGALLKRDELSLSDAEVALQDSDLVVREVALRAVARYREVTLTEARDVLIKRKRSIGFFALGVADDDSSDAWAQFRRESFARLSNAALEDIARGSTDPLDDAELIVLGRAYRSNAGMFHHWVLTSFNDEFDRRLTRLSETGKITPIGREYALSTRERTCRATVRRILDLIEHQNQASDIDVVRKALATNLVSPSQRDFAFLEAHGSWSDVPTIVAAADRRDSSSVFAMMTRDNANVAAAARSIYRLASGKLAKLFAIQMSDLLKVHLMLLVSDDAFRSLADETILAMLSVADSTLRKIVCLRCCLALTKSRNRRLLGEVMKGRRYYNVVHWLDFAISLPLTRCVPAARRQLNIERNTLSTDDFRLALN